MEDSSATAIEHVPSTARPTAECKICGDQASQKYVGVLVCPTCKTFFKRVIEAKQAPKPCPFDGQCQINIRTRHTCRACRLKKCLECGMQPDLLRGSLSKSIKTKDKRKDASLGTPTVNLLARMNDLHERQQFPTLNLLRADRSTLSIEQWNLLSNLVHCYDEHSGISVADRFVREQNVLPLKSRFKVTPVNDFITSLVGTAHLLFEKNADFLSLSSFDRAHLLRGRVQYVGGIGACFLMHTMGLYTNPGFSRTVKHIYGLATFEGSHRTGAQADSDLVFMKLVFAIVLFSTFDYTVYAGQPSVHFENLRCILKLQDTYIELAWRYLLYKYDHCQAVRCFAKAVRCIFALIDGHVGVDRCEHFTQMVDHVVKQVEGTLTISP